MDHRSGLAYYDEAYIANSHRSHEQRHGVNNSQRDYRSPYSPPWTTGTPARGRNTRTQRFVQSSAATLTRRSFRLVPILPPVTQPSLGFRPICLKAVVLLGNAVVCLILAACVLAAAYGFGSDHQAVLTSEDAHVLSTCGPALIAIINLMCFRVTFTQYFRMKPYFRMADQNGQITEGAYAAKSIGGSYFPWISATLSDDPWVKFIALLRYFIGFLTTFKSVFLGSQETRGGWILTVHVKPAYYLVVAYCAMAVFYIAVWLLTMNRSTGLKWDPAAPSDRLALVWRTDAMSHLAELPINYRKAHEVLRNDTKWRIGYWLRIDTLPNGSQITTIVHGIGTLGGPRGKPCAEEATCTCRHGRCNVSRYLYPPASRPLFLSTFVVSLLIFIGICVYVVAKGLFLNGQDLSGLWLKLNSTYIGNGTHVDASATDITNGYVLVAGQVITLGDSTTANIIFRAIPTYIAGLYGLYLDRVEIRLKDTMWISALAAGPQSSSTSLNLDYASQFSFMIPVMASENRNFRLALVAFVNTLAPLCPVFVAGLVFFERRSADHLHLVISKTSFVIVCVYLIFFLAAAIAAWPRKTELLLRPFFSIADSLKPFAHSWMLEENTALDSAMAEGTREVFRAKILAAKYRYQLGVVQGPCGKSHRGIDIVGNDVGDKFRDMVPADELIKEMRRRRSGESDGPSRIEAGLNVVQQVAAVGTLSLTLARSER